MRSLLSYQANPVAGEGLVRGGRGLPRSYSAVLQRLVAHRYHPLILRALKTRNGGATRSGAPRQLRNLYAA